MKYLLTSSSAKSLLISTFRYSIIFLEWIPLIFVSTLCQFLKLLLKMIYDVNLDQFFIKEMLVSNHQFRRIIPSLFCFWYVARLSPVTPGPLLQPHLFLHKCLVQIEFQLFALSLLCSSEIPRVSSSLSLCRFFSIHVEAFNWLWTNSCWSQFWISCFRVLNFDHTLKLLKPDIGKELFPILDFTFQSFEFSSTNIPFCHRTWDLWNKRQSERVSASHLLSRFQKQTYMIWCYLGKPELPYYLCGTWSKES